MSDTESNKQTYYVAKFIRTSNVKAALKAAGRRCSPEFLERLDRHVEDLVNRAGSLETGKKTLDGSAADSLLRTDGTANPAQ